jgi:hypothetical protein
VINSKDYYQLQAPKKGSSETKEEPFNMLFLTFGQKFTTNFTCNHFFGNPY